MQLHFAAQRNNNTRMFRQLGPDTGYDSIGPAVNLPDLARLLDTLEAEEALPKTILYSLDPNDNAALVTLWAAIRARESAVSCSTALPGGSMTARTAWRPS